MKTRMNDIIIKIKEQNLNYKNFLFPIIIFGIFMLTYVLSIIVTMSKNEYNFMFRSWNWTEYIIGIGALIVIFKNYKNIKLNYVITGLIFTLISCASLIKRADLSTGVHEGVILFCTFIGGCLLSQSKNSIKCSLSGKKFEKSLSSVIIGIISSIPLCITNFIYFRIVAGSPKWESPIMSAFFALQPGIAEEIIFRFFIMNVFIVVLSNKFDTKWVMAISIFFGVVPHSLIHFSQLWILAPLNAVFLLISTSLLFGLPMAYLQYKRDLECAIGFHWFIDFIRFIGGY